MLENTPKHPTKFKKRVEINYESRITCNTNIQIKLETSMLKWSLSNSSDEYILMSGTITATELATGQENNDIQVSHHQLQDALSLRMDTPISGASTY